MDLEVLVGMQQNKATVKGQQQCVQSVVEVL